jgi:molybdopterin-guanine dinucleotide biosynthesis protein A
MPVDELRAFDPALKTFTNINNIEDLEEFSNSRHGKPKV